MSTTPRAGRRPRLVAVAVAVIAVTAAAALAIWAAGEHGGGHPPAAAGTAAAASPAQDRTPAGAVSAAGRAVIGLAQAATAPPAERARQLARLVAADRIAAVGGRLVVSPAAEQATGLLADLSAGRPVVAAAVPVAARVEGYTGGAATVGVWTVTVLATRRLGAADASWSTETVALVFGSGRWWVTGYTSRGGPVPLSAQPPTGLDAVLTFAAPVAGAGYAAR